MENWLIEMEYFPLKEDLDDLLAQIRSVSSARTKKVWKHLVAHVRPKKEVEMIKKQCLLYRLDNSVPRYFNIEDNLNSMKDFELYVKKKRDLSRLNDLKNQVEKKKIAIMEHLIKLEHTRKNSLMEEEALRESVYKLNQLKKKKKTVGKALEKLENDTKVLKVLKTSPYNFVNFGPKPSDWERKVLIYVSELPPGLEFETIFSRMEELVKASQFSPLPAWDRTETLTEMENALVSKIKVLNNKRFMSVEIETELQGLLNTLFELIEQESNLTVNEVKQILDGFQNRILKEALEIGRGLTESKTPYVLESERYTVRRFMNLIDGKVKDLSKLLPADSGDCSSSDLPERSSSDSFDTSLPARPPARKLVDSIIREVECFMQLNLRQNLPDHIVDYVRPRISGNYQLMQLNDEMKIHSKLRYLDEKVRDLNLTIDDVTMNYVDLPEKISELNSSLSESMIFIKNETEVLDEVYKRVKAGFNFLRKEPLNEGLTGLQIIDKDISYWLNRYILAKKEHDHELWLLDNQK